MNNRFCGYSTHYKHDHSIYLYSILSLTICQYKNRLHRFLHAGSDKVRSSYKGASNIIIQKNIKKHKNNLKKLFTRLNVYSIIKVSDKVKETIK